MGKLRRILVALGSGAIASSVALGADVRYYEQDGITYRETRQVIRRPVTTTHYEQRQQTVYRQQMNTELRDTYRTTRTPVTEYQWVARVRGTWNPFVREYVSHELMPIKRWETRTEVIQVPTTVTRWVAENRTTQVPVTTCRMADEEVINRVAVGGTIPGNVPSIASRNSIGGVARLEGDPPRKSTGWQTARDAVRR